ncbi:MAG: 4Fe-4S binding protein [Firmicutes bacterium]|nr:4Fe-4S binding protein [Bacillota bacterium]
MDNLFAIAQSIYKNVENYEADKQTPRSAYDEILQELQRPYGDLRNYDDVIQVMKGLFSEDAARIWFAYPDFTVEASGRTVAEAIPYMQELAAAAKAGDPASRAQALTDDLVRANLLVKAKAADGSQGYLRNYLFGILNHANYFHDTDPFAAVAHTWWMNVANGDSKYFRNPITPYRIIPHEGTLDGSPSHGRIPMGLEIPDQRQIVPMDRLDQILESRYCIALIDCMCRRGQERNGTKACDHPIEDTCVLFNQMAEAAIEAGFGRKVTVEEAKDLVRACHDRGLVQEIGDAVNPLAMCNCCSCCCICLRSMNRFEQTIAGPSRWLAAPVHTDKCIGCGTCADKCPAGAVRFDGGPSGSEVFIDNGRCIGCGACVSLCPKAVLSMKVRPGAKDKPTMVTPERIYI